MFLSHKQQCEKTNNKSEVGTLLLLLWEAYFTFIDPSCARRVSTRADRAPPQHARKLLGQDHADHGGHVHRRDTFPRHCEHRELAPMYRFCAVRFTLWLLSLSPPWFAFCGVLLLQRLLVSRWTHANLKLIYIKCQSGDFDVWHLHITRPHMLVFYDLHIHPPELLPTSCLMSTLKFSG